jgi:hypothetical protein
MRAAGLRGVRRSRAKRTTIRDHTGLSTSSTATSPPAAPTNCESRISRISPPGADSCTPLRDRRLLEDDRRLGRDHPSSHRSCAGCPGHGDMETSWRCSRASCTTPTPALSTPPSATPSGLKTPRSSRPWEASRTASTRRGRDHHRVVQDRADPPSVRGAPQTTSRTRTPEWIDWFTTGACTALVATCRRPSAIRASASRGMAFQPIVVDLVAERQDRWTGGGPTASESDVQSGPSQPRRATD